MINREEIVKQPDYWMEKIQNEIYYTLRQYQELNNLNQSQLAKKLGFSKGYISQVLRGNFNHSVKKLIELGLALDKVLNVQFIELEDYLRLNDSDADRIIQLQSNTATIVSVQKQTFKEYA